MSEFSRETLLNIIETDHVQCGEASALARMALAAMDSEPVIVVGDDGGDALSYRRLIQSFEPGTKLYRHAQPAPVVPEDFDFNRFNDVVWLECVASNPHMHSPTTSAIARVALELNKRSATMEAKPVSQNEPISFDEWSRKCALQITLCYPDFREKAKYIWDSARETQQPALVVPDELKEAAADFLTVLDEYPEQLVPINRDSAVVRALRAAMLAAAPQEVKP
ncbi:hypothetical protein ACPEF7_10265 [Klebsiella sp. K769]